MFYHSVLEFINWICLLFLTVVVIFLQCEDFVENLDLESRA